MAYWKGLEHHVAEAIKGKRTSAPYRNAPDVTNNWLVVECKARQELPQWIVEAVNNAKRHSHDGQLGIAVLHEKGKHHKNDLVVLTFGDFQSWFGDALIRDPSDEEAEAFLALEVSGGPLPEPEL